MKVTSGNLIVCSTRKEVGTHLNEILQSKKNTGRVKLSARCILGETIKKEQNEMNGNVNKFSL